MNPAKIELEPAFENVAAARRFVADRLGGVAADAGIVDDLRLAASELVTNAVEHGLQTGGGTVQIEAERDGDHLRALVRDDGVGLPQSFAAGSDGLGTQIVQALVAGEMRGRIAWSTAPGGGTEVSVDVELRPQPVTSAPERSTTT